MAINTNLILTQTVTVNAAELFGGNPSAFPLPLVWTAVPDGKVTLTPSADTYSCAVKGVAVGGVDVSASIVGGPTSDLATFHVILGVDAIVLTLA